jgi:hypothetical protein
VDDRGGGESLQVLDELGERVGQLLWTEPGGDEPGSRLFDIGGASADEQVAVGLAQAR